MEAAAVASCGSGLRYLPPLDPTPRRQNHRAAVAGLGTKRRRPRAAVACRRPHRVHAAAARGSGGGAGDSSSGSGGVRSKKRLAVFVSSGGSNLRSIHEATAACGKASSGDVVALVTDKPGCGGAEYARRNGIPVVLFPRSKSAPEGVPTAQLLNALRFAGSVVEPISGLRFVSLYISNSSEKKAISVYRLPRLVRLSNAFIPCSEVSEHNLSRCHTSYVLLF
ncbi:hypothetical protein VPH35_011608 [Triticum aestivum]